MTPDKIIVLIAGTITTLFTYWFFFMKKQIKASSLKSGSIAILVSGGYRPDRIVVPYGKTSKLIFNRRDPSQCLDEVVLPDFRIKKSLRMNEKTEILITPNKKGEFDFSCGMGMYHGKLIVE